MVDETKRIAPRRDELITSDNRMTQRFAEFLESQTDAVNGLDEKSGVQDSLIALSNRQRGKITAIEQELADLTEIIFEFTSRKKPVDLDEDDDDERPPINILYNQITALKDRLDDIEAEAVHMPIIDSDTIRGPLIAADNALVRFNGTTGKVAQNSGVIIDNSDNLTGVGGIDMTTTGTSQLIVPRSNDAVSPTFAFGDGDSGLYESTDDILNVSIAGTVTSVWSGTVYSGGLTTANPAMLSEVSSSTNPVWSFVGDLDTGLGRAAANELSFIAGGVEIVRATATSLDFNQDLVATNGKGIDFAAYTDGSVAGTTTSQILLDYEEGLWTPVLSDGTNTATSTTSVGTYTKIGRMVHVKARLIVSSLGSTSGAVRITGLPYTASALGDSQSTANFGFCSAMNLTAGYNLAGYVETNNAYIVLRIWDTAGGQTPLTAAEWSATGSAMFEATYYV